MKDRGTRNSEALQTRLGLCRRWRPRLRRAGAHLMAAGLVVAVSVALGALSPAAASASDSVTSAFLQLSSLAPSATEVGYNVSFVATDGLTADHSTITLAAPSGTVFAGTAGADQCDVVLVTDDTTDQGSNCQTLSFANSDATISISPTVSVSAGDEVTVVAEGVTNDSSTAAQTLSLSTSSDPTAVKLAYTLSSSGQVGPVNFKQSSYTASATDVTYTASFSATDGLEYDGTDGVYATITVAAPSGTLFSGTAGGEVCGVYYVYDATTRQATDCVADLTFSDSEATATIEPDMQINAGDEVTVVATGVTNAPSSGTLHISTSSDPVAQGVTTGSATSSAPSLQLSSRTPSAAGTSYQVNFTTAHGLASGSSTITLTAPSGTTFASSSSGCTFFVSDDDTYGADYGCGSATGTGTDSVTITAPVSAGAGAEVTVMAAGVTNDSATSSQSLTLSDSADGSLGSIAYTLASSGKLSDLSLGLNTLTPKATEATYEASFVLTDALSNGASTGYAKITLAAPSATVFPSAAGDYFVSDDASNGFLESVPSSVVLSSSDATATLTLGFNVPSDALVTVVVKGVKNDKSTKAQSLKVSTSADPTAQSASYTLSSKGAVTGESLGLSSHAESAKDVSYSVSFVATDGLTSGFSTVKLAASKGTVFAGTSGENNCDVVYFHDDTSGTSTDCAVEKLAASGATLTIEAPFRVAAGDEVSIVADGVTNASGASDTLKVSTTSDPKAVTIKYTLH